MNNDSNLNISKNSLQYNDSKLISISTIENRQKKTITENGITRIEEIKGLNDYHQYSIMSGGDYDRFPGIDVFANHRRKFKGDDFEKLNFN